MFDKRAHVAGNCHAGRDPKSGVLLQVYGPHVFHTDDEEVWALVNRYMNFKPFVNRVKATTGGRVYSLPINLLTINQFFGKTFGPSEALRLIGRELYEAYFKGYMLKQWEVDPKRLPVCLYHDDNYFFHRFQGMPEEGCTPMVERTLDHPGITVHLSEGLSAADVGRFDHVYWSGPGARAVRPRRRARWRAALR